MKISVLTIGDELLNGEMSDTNTARIARLMGSHGYPIRDSLTVGDADTDIEEALLALIPRRDVIIVTGGLGPTGDDLTARAAARACKRRLIQNEEALGQIRNWFLQAGLEMHPRDEKQALLPQTATVIPNPRGTAPGFLLHHLGRDLFFLPGVPMEMEAMLKESVLPHLLLRGSGLPPARERVFILIGLTEPETEEALAGATLPEGVSIAFGVDFPYVLLKLRAAGPDAEALLERIDPLIRQLFGPHLAALGPETPAAAVARLLTESKLTLALAESCTGGLLCAQLTDIPGSSAFLERSAVTYSNSAKVDWLGVSESVLETEGAVSEKCALAMARGIRLAARSDLGVSITGIAGPTGGTEQKPVGTVYIALAGPGEERVRGYRFSGDRSRVRRLAACTALEWIRHFLVERSGKNT